MAGTTAKPGHSTIDNSTCAIVVRSVVNIQDSCQCRLCSHPASSRPGPEDRYAPLGLTFPPLRGGPLLVKPRTATLVHRPRPAVPQGNTSFLNRGPATGTGRSDTCVDRWRGQVQNFDLNGRSDAGHILQPQKTGMSWTAFPHTPANTKKSLQTISRLKTLSKHGDFLLSHLVWQYHRRRLA